MPIRVLRFALSLALIFTFLTAEASARNWTYHLVLKGIAAKHEGKPILLQKHDDIFLVTWVETGPRQSQAVLKTPGGEDSWRMKTGDIYSLDNKVWSGPAINLTVYAQIWKLNHTKRKILKGTFIASGIVLAAGITVATGGLGGALAAGAVAAGGAELGNEVQKNFSKFAMFLGQANIRLELPRAGKLADYPTHRERGIAYDFKTNHRANGGHYILYWEVKRD